LKTPSTFVQTVLLALLIALSLGASAEPSARPAGAAEDGAAPDAGQAEPASTKVDDLHASTAGMIDAAVRRFDSFFFTEAQETFEEDRNRLRLRLDTDYIEHHGWEFSPRVKVNFSLPGLSERVRLVVNDAGGDEEDQGVELEDDENDVALRWVARKGKKTGISIDGGVSFRGGKVDPFVRLNTSFKYRISEHWRGQATNRLYYLARNGWRDDLRIYFNRPIGERFLFRSRSRLEYFEDKDTNPQLEQKFSLFQNINDRSAIAYEAIWRQDTAEDSIFDDEEILVAPKDKYQQVKLRVRYRRNLWRPWMFVEFWPVVGWVEERDWETVLGARLRLEINFGWHAGTKLDE
jgi:hypothetical protein